MIEQGVGLWQRGNMLCGEESREALLPEVMGAFDFAFCLRGGRVAQGDIVKAQGGAELGEGVGDGGEEEGVVVDVESKREAGFEEGGWEQIEMGEEPFVVVDASAREHAAVIVNEFEQRVLTGRAGKPAVRSGVVLPELADVLSLPAADRAARFFGRSRRGEFFAESEAADGGAMERETMAAGNL